MFIHKTFNLHRISLKIIPTSSVVYTPLWLFRFSRFCGLEPLSLAMSTASADSPVDQDTIVASRARVHPGVTTSLASRKSSAGSASSSSPSAARDQDAGSSKRKDGWNKYDWTSHKAMIKQLYMDERRPLKEVMAVMRRDYNLTAT